MKLFIFLKRCRHNAAKSSQEEKIGVLPLVEGGGAKHSPPMCTHGKMRQKSSKINFSELGALPLGEGGGAKHSPLTGAHGKCGKNIKNHMV